jgi:hypothetical protein
LLTTKAKEWKIFACGLAARNRWDTGTVGVDAALLAQEIVSYALSHDPDMLLAEDG